MWQREQVSLGHGCWVSHLLLALSPKPRCPEAKLQQAWPEGGNQHHWGWPCLALTVAVPLFPWQAEVALGCDSSVWTLSWSS